MLKTPINRVDEFQAFNSSMRAFIETNRDNLPAVLKSLSTE